MELIPPHMAIENNFLCLPVSTQEHLKTKTYLQTTIPMDRRRFKRLIRYPQDVDTRQRIGVLEGLTRILNNSKLFPTQRKQSAAISTLMNVEGCLKIVLISGILIIKITRIETNTKIFDVEERVCSKASTISTISNSETESVISKLDCCISKIFKIYMKSNFPPIR